MLQQFPVAMIKKITLTKSTYVRKDSFWLTVLEFIMLRKAWQQELKATGHIATTVRKQRLVNAGA